MNREVFIGIELGSTRIKSVAVDFCGNVLAKGVSEWENRLTDGEWTYTESDIKQGIARSFAALKRDYSHKYGEKLVSASAMGISAMMHGYLAVDEHGKMLSKFLTWRNTVTGSEAEELTRLFRFNVPERWSVAHLYRMIKKRAKHLDNLYKVTTLAGWVHYLLTGKHVVGVCEASGIFPVDGFTYDAEKARIFDDLIIRSGYSFKTTEIFPRISEAGVFAGTLTEEGAALLDPTGEFKAGVPLCAPEGDAATGMVAANAVKAGTGNVSAGTSVFSMTVLDKPIGGIHREIDFVSTPEGLPVAMVHCNNGTGDFDDFVGMIRESLSLFGVGTDKDELYSRLLAAAKDADADVGGIVEYGLLSGESILGTVMGKPVSVRPPDTELKLKNVLRSKLYSVFAVLRIGHELLDTLRVKCSRMTAHGGYFKSETGLQIASDALKIPVYAYPGAGEGGAWGMALLALYAAKYSGSSLGDFLTDKIFAANFIPSVAYPTEKGSEGFDKFMAGYKAFLPYVRSIVGKETYPR